MKKTVCELFAGVGGFRIGLEESDPNWNTVWANQWEPGRKSQYRILDDTEYLKEKIILY